MLLENGLVPFEFRFHSHWVLGFFANAVEKQCHTCFTFSPDSHNSIVLVTCAKIEQLKGNHLVKKRLWMPGIRYFTCKSSLFKSLFEFLFFLIFLQFPAILQQPSRPVKALLPTNFAEPRLLCLFCRNIYIFWLDCNLFTVLVFLPFRAGTGLGPSPWALG